MSGRYGFSISDWIGQASVSKYFDSYKLYVLRVYSNNEEFIKVGRTFMTISNRYCNPESMPYLYEVLYEEIDNPYRIYKLENKIKRESKQFRYNPSIRFPGSTETFTIDILNDTNFKQHVNIKGVNILN